MQGSLVALVAKRHKVGVDQVEAANWFISNTLDKDDSQAKIAEKLAELPPSVFRLVEDALMEGGVLA